MASIVALHAHPDDEVLLTGGTLAKMAADGHDVQVVFATDGGAGLADPDSAAHLAVVRRAEAAAALIALGLPHPPVWLGFADSGEGLRRPRGAFADEPVASAAGVVAEILAQRGADVLLSYDRNGGYGHPDHRQVHGVGAAAAALAGTLRVLEATVDRTRLRWALELARRVPGLDVPDHLRDLDHAYLPRAEITHRVDVRGHVGRKRAAMAAHLSQAGGADNRTLAVLLRLPPGLARLALGQEWFRDPAAPRGRRVRTDLGLGSERW